jgi:hypothetical protein
MRKFHCRRKANRIGRRIVFFRSNSGMAAITQAMNFSSGVF